MAYEKGTFLQKLKNLLTDPKSILEIAGLIVLICYTHYAGQQRDAMNETLAEVRKQTASAGKSATAAEGALKAAQDALKNARDSFFQEERPYIFLTVNPGIDSPPTFVSFPGSQPGQGQLVWSYHFTNFGRSPAYNLHFSALIETGPNAMRVTRPFRLFPTAPVAPNQDRFSTVVSTPMIRQQFTTLMHTEDSIVVRVKFTYTDISGRGSYETGICFVHLVSGAAYYCPNGNYIN